MILKHFTSAMLATCIFTASFASLSTATEMIDRVAAVVNESVISYRDVTDRLQFAMKNLRAEPTAAQKEDLLKSQMDDLIEEELLRQYAESRNYLVEDAQVKSTIANMERASKQAAGSFKQFAGNLYTTAENQIRATVIKSMIVERELAPRILVGEDEVGRIVKSIISRQDELDEKNLAQIFIPVTEEQQASTARRTIDRIYSQLQTGSDFADLARTYSRDRSATEGGEIGWFRGGELIPVIDNAVKDLKKDALSSPVQSANGWHIFKVLDVREAPKPDMTPSTEVNITQLYAPIDSTSGTPAAVQNKKHIQNFNKIKKDVDNKNDFKDMVTAKIAETPLYFASGDMGWLNVDTLDPQLKTALKKAKKDTLIGPIEGEKGVYLFYVNDVRETEPAALQNIRARIQERLHARQTDLAFRSLMRDLRRKAFVEVRL